MKNILAFAPAGLLLGALLLLAPAPASAAVWSSPFEISGWIPYWRAATGTAEALQHIDTFKEINPFGYSVNAEGRLVDTAVMTQEPWTTLKAQAKANHVRFVPSVMWSDRDAIYNVLKDPAKRALLVRIIVDETNVNGYDGIDIDFENKSAETKPYFSAFLKELYKAMGNKWVQCTIEARTPLDSRYLDPADIPDDLSYVNDFAVIAKNCDRVRFMTYDQQTADAQLGKNAEDKGEVYGPVSDTRWVEKAIKEAMKTIPKSKIVIGIPTYGYEWNVTSYANNQHTYDLLWTFNPKYGLDLANEYNIAPGRNEGGELGFTYFPKDSAFSLARPVTPWPWNLIASAAAAVTTASNTNLTYRMVTWSDAQAIADKVALARRLGVRGVAIFKIDGGEDQGMWDVLK